GPLRRRLSYSEADPHAERFNGPRTTVAEGSGQRSGWTGPNLLPITIGCHVAKARNRQGGPMSSLNARLAIALSGLTADQSSIDASTNNVANVNTPGYSRQQAVLVASDPVVVDPLTFGTGVSVQSIESIRDPILEARIQQETQNQGELGSLVSALQQL